MEKVQHNPTAKSSSSSHEYSCNRDKMTDLTLTLSSLLVDSHKSEPISTTVSFRTLDAFLIEAKQIVRR